MSNITFTDNITDEMIINIITNHKEDSLLIDKKSQMIKMVNQYIKLGTVIAAIDENNDTLGIGGVGRVHTGVGVAWIIINNKFLKYPKTMLRICRKMVSDAIISLDLHRVQMDVETKFKENTRFAFKLGFSYEGRMHKYGPNKQDYDRYVLIKE